MLLIFFKPIFLLQALLGKSNYSDVSANTHFLPCLSWPLIVADASKEYLVDNLLQQSCTEIKLRPSQQTTTLLIFSLIVRVVQEERADGWRSSNILIKIKLLWKPSWGLMSRLPHLWLHRLLTTPVVLHWYSWFSLLIATKDVLVSYSRSYPYRLHIVERAPSTCPSFQSRIRFGYYWGTFASGCFTRPDHIASAKPDGSIAWCFSWSGNLASIGPPADLFISVLGIDGGEQPMEFSSTWCA